MALLACSTSASALQAQFPLAQSDIRRVIAKAKPRGTHSTITGMEERGTSQVIRAPVPPAEMFEYVNDLRSMTSGLASYSMEFLPYSEMPKHLADELIRKRQNK